MTDKARRIAFPLSKKEALALFLACGFLIHPWILFNFFGNADWLFERFNLPGMSVLAYFLVIGLIDTIILFLLVYFIGIFIPRKLFGKDLVTFLSLVSWNISLGMILIQFFLPPQQESSLPWIIGLVLFFIVFLTVIDGFFIRKRPALTEYASNLIGRVEVLTAFFLVLDIFSIFIIIFRNIY